MNRKIEELLNRALKQLQENPQQPLYPALSSAEWQYLVEHGKELKEARASRKSISVENRSVQIEQHAKKRKGFLIFTLS